MKTGRVFVIGGGPAGLVAAIAARVEGFDVTLADPRHPPIDKACGEGIMPDGVEHLQRLGVQFERGEVFPFNGIRYVEGGIVADGRFRGTPGLGVRRTILHEALRRHAEELGVELLWGHKVLHVGDDGVRVGGRSLAARWIIAADGQNSRARRLLGLDTPPVHRRFGLRRHYRTEPWCDRVEVHWSSGCEFYVTPVSAGDVCVAVLTHDPKLNYDAALERFPRLAQHLAGAPIQTDTLGGVSIYRRCPRVVRGNVALLGDASASVDAITGVGVTLALHQAVALARALRKGDLELYQAEHRRIMRLANTMTNMMLSIHHRGWLRRLTLAALSTVPGFFPLVLAIHTRAYSKRRAGRVDPGGPAQGSGTTPSGAASGWRRRPAGRCQPSGSPVT